MDSDVRKQITKETICRTTDMCPMVTILLLKVFSVHESAWAEKTLGFEGPGKGPEGKSLSFFMSTKGPGPKKL